MTETNDLYWLVTRNDEPLELDAGTRFWTELIREGDWTNARAGFTLRVDRDRLERWRDRFGDMLDAGIRVPVPWGHSYNPRDNAGFVEEIELRDAEPNGAALWGRLNVPDRDDADKLGKTVAGVSVSINPSFVDGTGRDWGEVIEHVALTNYPVVTGQGEFIEASTEGGEPKRALALEHAGPDEPDEGSPAVDPADNAEPAPQPDEPDEESPVTDRADNAEPAPGDNSGPETRNLARQSVSDGGPELAPHNSEPCPPERERRRAGTRNSELTNRLYQLELERAERHVDEAIRLGKFTRPAAEALRQLVALGIERRFSFDAAEPDVAALARDIIASTPAGAAVDMTEHTRVHAIPDPAAGMTEARAEQLAKENKALAGV